MVTKFGPKAQDGNYVIVLDVDYVHREARNYIAKVYKNKAYTGKTMTRNSSKYIHKMSAEIVIPEYLVPEDLKTLIERDINIHNNKEEQK